MKTYLSCFFAAIFVLVISACSAISSPSATPSQTPIPSVTSPKPEVTRLVDCSWSGIVKTWLDTNGNGIWDSSEHPLENVQFFVDDTHNGFENVGSLGVSDFQGTSELFVWLPGCPEAVFEVYAAAPDNYLPTSPSRVPASRACGDTFQFGFIYRPEAATATPRPAAAIACTSYTLHGIEPSDMDSTTDMAVAPDGAVWVTTRSGYVTRFAAGDQKRTTYSYFNGLPEVTFNAIAIGADGSVWIGTDDGAGYFNGSAWAVYTTTNKTGWGENRVEDIAIASDGAVWFANYLNGVSRYTPNTGIWEMDVISETLLTSDYDIDAIQVSPSGSIWFFSNTSIYQLTPSPESAWIIHKQDRYNGVGDVTAIDSQSAIVINDNEIWLIGSDDEMISVVELNPSDQKWNTYNYATTGGAMYGDAVTSLAIAPDNSIWIGFRKKGAMHFIPGNDDGQPGTWLYYNTQNGLLSDIIHKIVVTPDGSIWFGGDTGAVARCTEIEQGR